ncbi:MAG: Ppx/GppA family phosphatase [Gammaproteobacteria bacterium]|nr:Ppx/GppA family phosphatase [Gammaproteobacteria bacterium]
MNTTRHVVAIDIGSNSFHLIIAKEHAGCLTIVDRQKQQVSLSDGFDANGNLTAAAISRGVECLKEFSQRFSRLPHSAVRIVATHSLRKAKNRDQFIKAAFKVLPYPIEVIDGQTEAALIYQGVAHTQAIKGRTLVIDIGGGSTELVIGRHFDTCLKESLEIGTGQFRRQFFVDGNISQQQFDQAYDCAIIHLSTVADRFRQYGWKTVLGTSGAFKMIELCLKEINGSSKISAKQLKRLKKQLLHWQTCDNIPLRSIPADKLSLLPGAVAIVSACFDILAIASLTYCSGALREGVLYGLSHSRSDSDSRERTISSMCKLYHTDHDYSRRVIAQINQFGDQLELQSKQLKSVKHSSVVPLNDAELHALTWAAQLHEIGLSINSVKRQQHGAYIVQHSEMLGFSEEERWLLKILIGNHRGNIKLEPDLVGVTKARLVFLIALFRLAISCTQGRLNIACMPLKLQFTEQQIKVEMTPSITDKKGFFDELIKHSTRLQAVGLTLALNE